MTDSASGAASGGIAARRLAVDLLQRIDEGGAFANLLVPKALAASQLSGRDRALVTNLTYGATRMRRACDWLVDRYLTREVEPAVRAALRVGAFQLVFTDVPDHAAVATSVEVTPKRARGLVNAVLRKVASGGHSWPDEATRLSYPDWIVDLLIDDLGHDAAVAALGHMNTPPTVTVREDGYVQDLGSQWVADEVPASGGATVIDACAAPGGKATALAATGALVVAADGNAGRVGLIVDNAARLGCQSVTAVAADATAPPFRVGSAQAVLVDAPCSGLGVLRRRPDARWRVEPGSVGRLADLQTRMLEASAASVAPGGMLIYSVCTLTRAETSGVADAFTAEQGDFVPDSLAHGGRWRPCSTGGLLLPQDHDTDGMAVFRWRCG